MNSKENNSELFAGNPNYITTAEVSLMLGVSRQKLLLIIQSDKHGFPKNQNIPKKKDVKKIKFFFLRHDVVNWIENNDPKKISCYEVMRNIDEKKQEAANANRCVTAKLWESPRNKFPLSVSSK